MLLEKEEDKAEMNELDLSHILWEIKKQSFCSLI